MLKYRPFRGSVGPHPALGVCYHSVCCDFSQFSYCVSTPARIGLRRQGKCFPRQRPLISARCSPRAALSSELLCEALLTEAPSSNLGTEFGEQFPFGFLLPPERADSMRCCLQPAVCGLALESVDRTWRHQSSVDAGPIGAPAGSGFNSCRGFPGGAVVKNPPANAGDMSSSPGPGRSHMPRSN